MSGEESTGEAESATTRSLNSTTGAAGELTLSSGPFTELQLNRIDEIDEIDETETHARCWIEKLKYREISQEDFLKIGRFLVGRIERQYTYYFNSLLLIALAHPLAIASEDGDPKRCFAYWMLDPHRAIGIARRNDGGHSLRQAVDLVRRLHQWKGDDDLNMALLSTIGMNLEPVLTPDARHQQEDTHHRLQGLLAEEGERPKTHTERAEEALIKRFNFVADFVIKNLKEHGNNYNFKRLVLLLLKHPLAIHSNADGPGYSFAYTLLQAASDSRYTHRETLKAYTEEVQRYHPAWKADRNLFNTLQTSNCSAVLWIGHYEPDWRTSEFYRERKDKILEAIAALESEGGQQINPQEWMELIENQLAAVTSAAVTPDQIEATTLAEAFPRARIMPGMAPPAPQPISPAARNMRESNRIQGGLNDPDHRALSQMHAKNVMGVLSLITVLGGIGAVTYRYTRSDQPSSAFTVNSTTANVHATTFATNSKGTASPTTTEETAAPVGPSGYADPITINTPPDKNLSRPRRDGPTQTSKRDLLTKKSSDPAVLRTSEAVQIVSEKTGDSTKPSTKRPFNWLRKARKGDVGEKAKE